VIIIIISILGVKIDDSSLIRRLAFIRPELQRYKVIAN